MDGSFDQPGIFALKESVGDWTGRLFKEVDGLLYIGAAGIAVRAVAPYLKDKMTDPAVVVIDEQGKYAISLLAGHVGGANRLAVLTGEILGAVPVITTASDVQGRTAVDVWAADRGLKLSDRELAKRAAAALVNGENVGLYSDYPVTEPVPEGYVLGQRCGINVWVTSRLSPDPNSTIATLPPEEMQILRLIPASLVVGIGCRRDVETERVKEAVEQTLLRHGLDLRAVDGVASIDLKREERGIMETAGFLGVPFVTFSAGELEQVEGEVSESAFVRNVTGTGNVCERAALLGAGPGSRLLVRKEICGGITVAVAEKNLEIAGM